jgi:hypothetical protein
MDIKTFLFNHCGAFCCVFDCAFGAGTEEAVPLRQLLSSFVHRRSRVHVLDEQLLSCATMATGAL